MCADFKELEQTGVGKLEQDKLTQLLKKKGSYHLPSDVNLHEEVVKIINF